MSSGPQRAAEQDEDDRIQETAAKIRQSISSMTDEALDTLYGQTIGALWHLRDEGLSFVLHQRLDILREKWEKVAE